MGITRKLMAAAFVLAGCVALFSIVPRANAAQAAAGETIPQEVPNNPAVHTPPVQPIPYSHKIHLAQGLTCPTCHKNPEPGILMTYPAATLCMGCHKNIAQDKPAIRKLNSYARSNQPVPWVRIYTVLPGVTWTHQKHIAAGIKCEACHGQVREMDVMSEVTSVTTMAVCLNCHKAHNAPTVCQTCHPWPPAQAY